MINTQDLQLCTHCNIEKPLTSFDWQKGEARPRKRCKDCRRIWARQYKQKNSERVHKQHADYRQRRASIVKAGHKRWYNANREKYRNAAHLHLAKKYGATIGEVRYSEVLERDNFICYLCSNYIVELERTIDHVIPLSRGGEHTMDNLRAAHRGCNSRKGNRLLSELDGQ